MNKGEQTKQLSKAASLIDLSVNYLSCLGFQIVRGDNESIIYSLSNEQGLDHLMDNLEEVSESIKPISKHIDESEE